MSEAELMDEQHQKLSNQKQLQKQPLKVWPEWGTLEPCEVAGAQLFLCTEAAGSGPLVAAVEVTVDQNPELLLYIPVFADIHAPYLTLRNGLFELQNLFTFVPSDCSVV